MGGITYGRVMEGLEILRPDFEKTVKSGELDGLEEKVGQQAQL